LSLGDDALASDRTQEAIMFYDKGINSLKPEASSLVTSLSLFTNLGTALSSVGQNTEAIDAYRKGLQVFDAKIDDVIDKNVKVDANMIAAQNSFFLGMVYEELEDYEKSANAYSFANTLDRLHWSSMANLGALLADHLRQLDEALAAYNKAYEILTQSEREPTDAPALPEYVLAELQYRIGYILMLNPERKCALTDKPDKEVSCSEMATHAFSLALKYRPDHESAKHMLATLTADATMTRASNEYISQLFDEYAKDFEHSLVEELQYNGYERLRRSFDQAFSGEPPVFELVVDAGCGTGLVGKQFRNISQYLIGVDLSPAILREAEKARPNLYNETIAGDVTKVFVNKSPISLIVAADSYIYFGDLEPLFASMEEGLAEGGFAAFTLENVDVENEELLQKTKPDWRWQLTASGRFAHRREYVEYMANMHQLQVVRYEALDNFRYEGGTGVRGHVFILKKSIPTIIDHEL
jgi:predicted TPR repeat methyltransferase